MFTENVLIFKYSLYEICRIWNSQPKNSGCFLLPGRFYGLSCWLHANACCGLLHPWLENAADRNGCIWTHLHPSVVVREGHIGWNIIITLFYIIFCFISLYSCLHSLHFNICLCQLDYMGPCVKKIASECWMLMCFKISFFFNHIWIK